MTWTFPAVAGSSVEVRLYFANRYSGTSQPGQRVFDVTLDGQPVLVNYDIVADVGDQTGEMKAFDVQTPSNGQISIVFSHVVENPLVNGIEIVQTGQQQPPPPPGGLEAASFDGTTAGVPSAVDPDGLDWSTVRGAFMLGSTLYYGDTDGFMYKRSFDGSQLGAATQIDPYRDATWDGVKNGSGDGSSTTGRRWRSTVSWAM